MAESPAHKWGQIIGEEILEVAIESLLREISDTHNLYLDHKGPRPARGKNVRVAWKDHYGNEHFLDYVLERGGTLQTIGTPCAFVETAWRSYTKHSKNKAQEIQGAVVPIANTHHLHAPFMGAILAGDFTEGSLTQLKSLGFRVLYFPYERIVDAFRIVRIDARFDEDTPDAECAKKIKLWEELSQGQRDSVTNQLLKGSEADVRRFKDALTGAILRTISIVRILPLHGIAHELETVEKAIDYLNHYDEKPAPDLAIAKYEVQIRYNNGDRIDAFFERKADAISHLSRYLPEARPATS